VRDRVQSFRTFPEGAASFTFALGSCQLGGSNGQVFDAIRATDPLFVLSMGDWNYGTIDRNDPDLETDDPRPHIGSAQAIVFAAGAGPGSGAERKRTVDLGAAVKLIEAARELGVARYVMVSAMGTQDVQNAGEAMRPYLQAKKDADDALMQSGLDWTVVRPGRLTDDPGTGTVDAARALGRRGEITRDDTALVLLEALVRPSLSRVAFDVLEGPTPVAEALDAL
jgi:nucleoside-diphosphate-sugar epimerase